MYGRATALAPYETGLGWSTGYDDLHTREKHMLYSLIEIFMKERHIQLDLDLNPEVKPFIPHINDYRESNEETNDQNTKDKGKATNTHKLE